MQRILFLRHFFWMLPDLFAAGPARRQDFREGLEVRTELEAVPLHEAGQLLRRGQQAEHGAGRE